MQRWTRTRQLVELGGLVQKAGLVELTDDDRATIYGTLLELAAKAREGAVGDAGDAGAAVANPDVLATWKRRGRDGLAITPRHRLPRHRFLVQEKTF